MWARRTAGARPWEKQRRGDTASKAEDRPVGPGGGLAPFLGQQGPWSTWTCWGLPASLSDHTNVDLDSLVVSSAL